MKDAKDKEGHSIKILGRAGLIYRDKKNKYFIDSEMLVGPEFDIVIYTNSVRLYSDLNNSISIPQTEKEEIIKIVMRLLKSSEIKADFQPRLSFEC